MNAKTLALTAIICTASFFGMNLTAAYAASFDTAINFENNIQTEQLSQKVRDRNRAIGAVLGIAAIAAIVSHNDKHSESNSHENYNRNGRSTPPPPPMPNHQRR